MGERRVAVVFGAVAGSGGLGLQAATALASFARGGAHVTAIGLGQDTRAWPLDRGGERIEPVDIGGDRPLHGRRVAWTPLRWRAGLVQWANDVSLGRAAARALDAAKPDLVYAFTQVAEEALVWCRARRVPSILDNPNGHIRNFARIYTDESVRWLGARSHAHPTPAMVRRVEREYALADRVRVSSTWAKRSMVEGGVRGDTIGVVDQPIDVSRFSPADEGRGHADERRDDGPLRLCYAGTIDVRKGVFHLLHAMRQSAVPTKLTAVGGTGTRSMARAVAREREGLDVLLSPGDPVPAYRASELFVLPSLEDGFGFVVAEAMACGLPVIVTDQCGSAEWVSEASAGWVVPAGDAKALAKAIREAFERRSELPQMGARGLSYVRRRADTELCCGALADWAWRLTPR